MLQVDIKQLSASLVIGVVSLAAWAQTVAYDHDAWKTKPIDIVRTFGAFVVSFDSDDDDDRDGDKDALGEPEWVAYEVRARTGFPGKAPERPRTWATDADLFRQGVAPNDASYRNSGFSRGHLCPKFLAFRLGAEADRASHTVLNACPQTQRFNAGIWFDLEPTWVSPTTQDTLIGKLRRRIS